MARAVGYFAKAVSAPAARAAPNKVARCHGVAEFVHVRWPITALVDQALETAGPSLTGRLPARGGRRVGGVDGGITVKFVVGADTARHGLRFGPATLPHRRRCPIPGAASRERTGLFRNRIVPAHCVATGRLRVDARRLVFHQILIDGAGQRAGGEGSRRDEPHGRILVGCDNRCVPGRSGRVSGCRVRAGNDHGT